MELSQMSCVPCSGGVPPMERPRIEQMLTKLQGWDVVEDHHLTKSFHFPDFKAALDFVNRVGAVAEQQGHHPDLHLSWGKVQVDIWTHKAGGLTDSDFILAAKCDVVRRDA